MTNVIKFNCRPRKPKLGDKENETFDKMRFMVISVMSIICVHPEEFTDEIDLGAEILFNMKELELNYDPVDGLNITLATMKWLAELQGVLRNG